MSRLRRGARLAYEGIPCEESVGGPLLLYLRVRLSNHDEKDHPLPKFVSADDD